MKSSRLRATFATLFVFGLPLAAGAAPGDPRLVTGAVEWPATLTTEPFVVVRGTDGVLYYVGVTATRRDGTVTAGSRVSILGLEGRNRHEINAVGIGSGATADAALAQLLDTRPPVATPPAAVAVPASDAAPSPAAKSAPPAAQASRPPGAPSPKVGEPAAPAPMAAGAAPAPTVGAAAPAPKPGNGEVAHVVVPAAPSPKPTTGAPASTPVAVATPTAPMMIPTDKPRWIELVGEVETILGNTIVLRVDGGRVSVDVSSLRGVERSVVPGATVKVYGIPVELRFKAMGFIESNVRAHGPRQN